MPTIRLPGLDVDGNPSSRTIHVAGNAAFLVKLAAATAKARA